MSYVRPWTLLAAMLLAIVGGRADAAQVLVNGGFETGDLTGWTQLAGMGHVVTMNAGVGVAATNPATPRSGQFAFSSAVPDGALSGTPEISLSQTISLAPFASAIATGNGALNARGFFAGAQGDATTSDDTAHIAVEFFDGAASLGGAATTPLDPIVGFYNEVTLTGLVIPVTADSLRFTVVTRLDPGFASIDILTDDLEVEILDGTVIPEPTTAALLAIPAAMLLVRRRR